MEGKSIKFEMQVPENAKDYCIVYHKEGKDVIYVARNDEKEKIAMAEKIVLAVNNFDALVEALETTLSRLKFSEMYLDGKIDKWSRKHEIEALIIRAKQP